MEHARPESGEPRPSRAAEPPPDAEGAGLGQAIAQALQPALTEFEHRLVQTVYRELEQAVVSERPQRPRGEPPAGEPSAGWGAAGASRGESKGGGAQDMATEAAQRDRHEAQAPDERPARGADQPERRGTARPSRGEERLGADVAPRRRSEMARGGDAGRQVAPPDHGQQRAGYVFDPRAAARVGFLSIASRWKAAGSTYSAVHAYEQILCRYPDSGAAAAATEELVDLARTLAEQGKFYSALHVLETLDGLL